MKIDQAMIERADAYWQQHVVAGGCSDNGNWRITTDMSKGFSLEGLLAAALDLPPRCCGCPCDPEGKGGFSCPRADGTLRCQDPLPKPLSVIYHPDYVRVVPYCAGGFNGWQMEIMVWDTRDAHVHLYRPGVTAPGYATKADAEALARRVAKHRNIEYRE